MQTSSHARRSTKAQMKIGETMMILVIFFVLLVLGLIFYIRFQMTHIENQSIRNAEYLAIQTIQKIQFLPEFQCTIKGKIKFNCLDVMRAKAVSKINAANPEYTRIYSRLFPQSMVSVYRVYPQPYGNMHGMRIYGTNLANNSMTVFPVPITLYNASSESYEWGYLNITVFT